MYIFNQIFKDKEESYFIKNSKSINEETIKQDDKMLVNSLITLLKCKQSFLTPFIKWLNPQSDNVKRRDT